MNEWDACCLPEEAAVGLGVTNLSCVTERDLPSLPVFQGSDPPPLAVPLIHAAI